MQNLLSQRRKLTEDLNDASNELTKEEAGIALSRKVGRGPIWNAKKQRKNDCENALNDWDQVNMGRVKYLQQSSQNAAVVIEQKTNKLQTMGDNKGFCVRYEAFANIKKENESVRLVSIFIMLMFIIIEIAPTFFKMMVAAGPYDDLLRAEAFKKKAYADQVIAETKNELYEPLPGSVSVSCR